MRAPSGHPQRVACVLCSFLGVVPGFVGRASLVCGALVGGLRDALLVPVLLVCDIASAFASIRAHPRGCGLMATAQPTSGTKAEAAHAATPLTISPSSSSHHPRVSAAGRAVDAMRSPRAYASVGQPIGAADIPLYGPSQTTGGCQRVAQVPQTSAGTSQGGEISSTACSPKWGVLLSGLVWV